MNTRDEFSYFLNKKVKLANYRFPDNLCNIINNTFSKDELLDSINNLKTDIAINYYNQLLDYIMSHYNCINNININDEFLLLEILETFESQIKELKDNTFCIKNDDGDEEEITFKKKYLSVPKVTISDIDEE